MRRLYTSPIVATHGYVVGATNNSVGTGADSFTKQMPMGSVGFLL